MWILFLGDDAAYMYAVLPIFWISWLHGMPYFIMFAGTVKTSPTKLQQLARKFTKHRFKYTELDLHFIMAIRVHVHHSDVWVEKLCSSMHTDHISDNFFTDFKFWILNLFVTNLFPELWKKEIEAKRERILSLDDMKLLSTKSIITRRNNQQNENSSLMLNSLQGSFRRLEVD